MRKIITMLVVMIINNFAFVYAADTDYLLLQDISSYKFITQNRDPLTKKTITIPGYTTRTAPGVLAGADHFDIDHDDTTYETVYESDITDLGVRVQVTKHAGSDSDKWLLHEVDADFRNYYGIPGMAYTTRQVDSQTMLVAAVGGREYRWLSGNKVVVIKYHGSLTQKPEPLEVINAYLSKHPSIFPAITLTQLRSADSKTHWIKDEMDRRLWLCEKWFMQLQLRKVEETQVYQESVKSMNIFLDYRERYYGLKAADEKNLLAGYLNTNNGTGIKAKLDEYKKWWVVNKEKAINL